MSEYKLSFAEQAELRKQLFEEHSREKAQYGRAREAEKARQEFTLAHKLQEKRQQRLSALQRHAERESMKTSQSMRKKKEQTQIVQQLIFEHGQDQENAILAQAAEQSRQRNELRLRLMQRRAALAAESKAKKAKTEAEQAILDQARARQEKEIQDALDKVKREEEEQQARQGDITKKAASLMEEHERDEDHLKSQLKLEHARQNMYLRNKLEARREQLQRQRAAAQARVSGGSATEEEQREMDMISAEIDSLSQSLKSLPDLSEDDDLAYAIAKTKKVRELAAMDEEIRKLAEEEAEITLQYMQAQAARLTAENSRIQQLEEENQRLAADRARLEQMNQLQREISELREQTAQTAANEKEIAILKEETLETAKYNTQAFIEALPPVDDLSDVHSGSSNPTSQVERTRQALQTTRGEVAPTYKSILVPNRADDDDVWNPVFGGSSIFDQHNSTRERYLSDHELALKLQREEQMRIQQRDSKKTAQELEDERLARELQAQFNQGQGASSQPHPVPVAPVVEKPLSDEELARRLQAQFDMEDAGGARGDTSHHHQHLQQQQQPASDHYQVPVYPTPARIYPGMDPAFYDAHAPKPAAEVSERQGPGILYTCANDTEFQQIAIELGNRPVLIQFFMPYSNPSRRMDHFVRTLANKYPSVTFVRCDLTQCQHTAGPHVRSVPHFRAVKDMKQVGELGGSNPVALENLVRAIAD